MKRWLVPSVTGGVALVMGLLLAAAPSDPVKVMALGDSVTYGYPEIGGYRVELARMARQAGMSIDFVGAMQDGPPELADLDHEGHGGWRIDQLTPRAQVAMQTFQPDIVLLHIGTNDLGEGFEVEQAPARLRALVDVICTSKPGVQLVVASIGAGDNVWDRLLAFNAAIPGVVDDARSSGCRVSFLDINKSMVRADFVDDAHPNLAGYEKMARSWFPVLRRTYDDVEKGSA